MNQKKCFVVFSRLHQATSLKFDFSSMTLAALGELESGGAAPPRNSLGDTTAVAIFIIHVPVCVCVCIRPLERPRTFCRTKDRQPNAVKNKRIPASSCQESARVASARRQCLNCIPSSPSPPRPPPTSPPLPPPPSPPSAWRRRSSVPPRRIAVHWIADEGSVRLWSFPFRFSLFLPPFICLSISLSPSPPRRCHSSTGSGGSVTFTLAGTRVLRRGCPWLVVSELRSVEIEAFEICFRKKE